MNLNLQNVSEIAILNIRQVQEFLIETLRSAIAH